MDKGMDNRTKHRKNTAVRLTAVLLITGLAFFVGYRYMQLRSASEHADKVMKTLSSVIPGFGEDTGVSSSQGRDPLPAVVIDDKDIVGCIEVPSIDLAAPVTAAGYEEEGFASVVDGSPVKGRFRLRGGRDDVFRKLAKAQPGDTAVFTDIDGVRYHYRVTTQFHLKDWNEADNDLMLCYRTDDQTRFVLGCTRSE